MGWRYRLQQFALALTAGPLPPQARAEVAAVLDGPADALFGRFPDSDSRHSLRVYRLLRDSGHDDPDLLTAALLHDIGKVRLPLRSWERALVVVVEKAWPEAAARWGQGAAAGWRRPFVVRQLHPQWGAELAEEAGVAAPAVTLIRYHQAAGLPVEDGALAEKLRLLQWADNQC